MSLILSSWLNDDVKLSRKVSATELDSSFRTGYLLGELLYKTGVIVDFAAVYTPLDGPDACIRNFTALERTLRDKLGVKLSSKDAIDLIKARPGCAANLLLAIKTALNTQRTPTLPNAQSLGLSQTRSSLGSLEGEGSPQQQTRSLAIKFDSDLKRKFAEKEHDFFAEMLRSKLKRTDSVPAKPKSAESTPVKPVESPTIRVARRFLDSTTPPSKSSKRDEEDLLARSMRGAAPAVEPPQKLGLVATPNDADARRARQSELEQRKRKSAAKSFETQVASFEKLIGDAPSVPSTLERGESMEIAPFDDAKEIRRFMTVRAPMEAQSHIKMLKSQIPPEQLRKEENREYLENLRTRKKEEDAARRDRELRRRQEVVAQKVDMDKTQENKLDEVVLARLMRQSKQERRIAEQLMQVRREKEVMRENRVFREMQYAQQRYRDNEMETSRESEIARRAREEYAALSSFQMQQHKEILARRTLEKRKKHSEFCSYLVWQFVELATKISEYRTLNEGKEVPMKLVREWKTLFLNGYPLQAKYELELEKDAAKNLSELAQPQLQQQPTASMQVQRSVGPDSFRKHDVVPGIELLDSTEFSDYLNASGDWASASDSDLGTKKNELLATLVDNILALSQPAELAEAAKLRNVRLRLCVVGRRYSGQRTLCAALASTYGIQVLQTEEIVKDAIKQAKSKDIARPATATQDGLPSIAELGTRLELSLLEGSAPDDATLVGAVATAIKKCEEARLGWVLCNFPKSRYEAQLLERYLSGYEEPKAVKPGNLKRGATNAGPGSASTAPQSKPIVAEIRKSLIAPISNSVNDAPLKPLCSALDAVFLLDIDNDLAVRRSAGRRVDPVTGVIYHLEFNPPPTGQQGVLDRLVALPDVANETAQIQNQLALFDEEELGLKDWFGRFQNLHVVDGSAPPTSVFSVVEGTLKVIVKSIDQSIEAAKAAALAKEAEAAAKAGGQPQVSTTTHGEEGVATIADGLPPKPKTPTRPDSRSGARPVSPGKDAKPTARTSSPPKDAKSSVTPPGINQTAVLTDPPPTVPGTSTINVPPSVPPTLVRSTGPDGKKIPDKDLIDTLSDQWTTVETSYTDEIKFILRSLRREREFNLRHFFESKVAFKQFLERPDRRQVVIDLFQKEFNEIEEDLRYDNDVKAELHQRVEDLREKLWDLSDMRREEADAERAGLIEDRWVEDHMLVLTNCYVAAVQAEVERYTGTRQIVLDYYRDAYSALLLEHEKIQVRVPIATARHSNAGDVSLSAYDLHRDASTRKRGETPLDAPKPATASSPPKSGSKVSAAPTTPSAKDVKRPATNARSAPSAHVVENPTYADSESAMLADLQRAIEAAISIPVPTAEALCGGKKDGHAKRAETAGPAGEEKITSEYDPEIPIECFKTLELEDQMYRWRIERLRQRGTNDIKELRAKAIETFSTLSDWTNQRFQAEMDGVRDISLYIRDNIENESKLPVALVLEGPKFTIENDVLTFEPEPEPRPGSPVERNKADQFTIAQIAALALQYRGIAPSGTVSIKDFIGVLERTALNDRTLVPESLATSVVQEQVAASLDLFETGFVSWRRFLFTVANVLPVVGDDTLINLAKRYKSCPSYQDGQVSQPDFLSVPLWFESGWQADARKFNRPAKLKLALCVLFGDGPLPASIPFGFEVSVDELQDSRFVISGEDEEDGGNPAPADAKTPVGMVNVLELLMYSSADFSPNDGLVKALGVSNALTSMTIDDIYKVFHLGLERLPDSQRVVDDEFIYDPYPKALLLQIAESMSKGNDMPSAFIKSARGVETTASIVACPLYELSEVMLIATRSRLSTGLDKPSKSPSL
ncbi:adenylate kinase [Synchytrium microbalum]|uniref:Adenylate kinase n=1 Tax=Synchytrium microbalum TaxID=1806994 RepID=A0A507CIL7_9FUNG|nr:adenylate kinase [Synchytrium microbalum]TPX38066.1 adenylate kinase [Synchytrium microbalum]